MLARDWLLLFRGEGKLARRAAAKSRERGGPDLPPPPPPLDRAHSRKPHRESARAERERERERKNKRERERGSKPIFDALEA